MQAGRPNWRSVTGRSSAEQDALNPGAKAVLQRLSETYRLGMITNGYSDSQRGRLGAARLLDVFDPLLISEEVGVAQTRYPNLPNGFDAFGFTS